jgi:hypothetical protein
MNKNIIALLFFIAAAVFLCTASSGQSTKRNPFEASEYQGTIEGLVRDIACPIQNHKSTATKFNLDCAIACAKSGSPLIILTGKGDIYFPISGRMPDASQREKLSPFVGKYVRVSGTVYTRNGTRTIAIKEIKELPEVKLNSIYAGD